MLTHTYHGRDVWEVRDRIGNFVSHMVNGPPEGVRAVVERMRAMWPSLRTVSETQQAQGVEVVLHRNHHA